MSARKTSFKYAPPAGIALIIEIKRSKENEVSSPIKNRLKVRILIKEYSSQDRFLPIIFTMKCQRPILIIQNTKKIEIL